MTPDFAVRSTAAEWMDGECDEAVLRDCLRDLARVNVLTMAHRPTIAFLDRLYRQGRLELGRPVEIVDAGSGYGDLLAAIDRWARRRRVAVRLTGVDLSPASARAARQAHGDGLARWVTGDVLRYDVPCDVVVSSLFTHHLSNDDLVVFLRWMDARAGVGWFVNDLLRRPFPYYGFGLLARLMRWHPFVRHDGPISIARAFTPWDWAMLLRRADLSTAGVEVRRWFPFRLCLAFVRKTP